MKALKSYMRVNNLTQLALSHQLGIGQGQLNHWLNGRRKPTVKSLKLVASKTGLTIEQLTKDL